MTVLALVVDVHVMEQRLDLAGDLPVLDPSQCPAMSARDGGSGGFQRDLARKPADSVSRFASGSPLGVGLTVAATLSEWKGAEARNADELLALLTEPVLPLGQPCEGVLDLQDLLGPASYEGDLNLRVKRLSRMRAYVREGGVLGVPILSNDGLQRPSQAVQLVPQEPLQLADEPVV